MHINNSIRYQPQFKAIRIAQVKNYLGNTETIIDLYKLTNSQSDLKFINNIKYNKLFDFKHLCSQMHSFDQTRWRRIFDYCIAKIESGDNAYIAVSENRPCGIMAFFEDKNITLDGICAIPKKNGKKVPLTGKTLFLQLFREAKSKNVKNISLEAVEDGPYNVIKKYEELGFKKQNGEYQGYTSMVSNKYNSNIQIKNLSKELDYIKTEPEKTDLNTFID